MVTSFHFPNRWRRFTITIALFLCAAWQTSTAQVEARLDRNIVPVGNGALLTLSISGNGAGNPDIPAVENLIVQPRGQSQNYQLANGRTSRSVTYSYVVGSNTEGDYEIPPIAVTVDGTKHLTTALKLKVIAASATQPPPGMPATPPGSEPVEDEEPDTSGRRFGFLTVELQASDRKHVYVGEIAPVRIQAWLPEDSRVQLRSGIQPEGKAFTLHNVNDTPRQTREVRDGKRYTVVTWFGGISATKAGTYPASLSLNANVTVRDTSGRKRPRPRRRTGGPFDDPFFDSIFDQMNAPMIQKDVTLKSEDQEIEVRALPTEGRPADFTGAVGNFSIAGSQIPTEWKTGEPQQIRANIQGSGNFALMKAPELTPAEDWKTYPGKDDFTPGDVASFSGNKRFQFSAVPRKGGQQELALTFSFFDPEAGTYTTLTSPPSKIVVSGEDVPNEEPEVGPAAAAPENPREHLIGQHQATAPVQTLVPLVSRPAFARLLGVSAVLCVLGGLIAWFRARRTNPARLARAAMEKSTCQALRNAAACAEDGNVPGFFGAARLALQQHLGAMWNQPAQAITLAEVAARIPDDSPVVRFFREADRHTYSRPDSGEILPQWQSLLTDALESLEPTAR